MKPLLNSKKRMKRPNRIWRDVIEDREMDKVTHRMAMMNVGKYRCGIAGDVPFAHNDREIIDYSDLKSRRKKRKKVAFISQAIKDLEIYERSAIQNAGLRDCKKGAIKMTKRVINGNNEGAESMD
ncbi:hypothetical protein ACOME3_005615 [Neoechinorhynchus agilis]